MAQEIVDVSGQTGNQILQTLNKRGVQTSLVNLVQSTGAESARNIPRFIIVEDGQVKGGTDTQPQTEPQTAMDLKPADIVQETKIDRQPIPRQRPIVRNTVQQDLDTLELTDDSIKSALQQNLETIADSPGLTGLVDVGKEMLLDAAPEILPSVYSDEAKAQEPEEKISATDALIEKGGEVVKDLIMPEDTEAEPNLEVAPQAIATAEALQQPAVPPKVESNETTEDTTVTRVTNESGVKEIIEDEDAANAVIEIAETEFMFEDGLDVTALQDINEEIKANNEKLLQISEGKIQPYFGKEDTGRKFLAAIAAGLGAYASAMTGTPNFALNIINKAIDDDLAIQKEQLERQRTSLLTQNEILAQRKAELYAEADRLFERQTTIAGLELDDKRLKQAREEARLAYDAALAKNRLAQDEVQRLRRVKLVGNDVGEFGDTMSKEEILKVYPEFNKFVGGYMKIMGNPDADASFYDSMDQDYRNLVSLKESNKGLIQQLIDIAEAQPVQAKISVTESGKKVRQLHALLKSYYQREIAQAGANLTGTEVVIIDRIVGDPDVKDLAFGTYVSGLRNLQNEMARTYRDALRKNDIVNIRTRGQQNQQGTQKKRRFDASKAQKVGNIN